MKDRFFEFLNRLYNHVFRLVTRVAYIRIVRKRCKQKARLTKAEKKRVSNFWKEMYGKKPSYLEYEWYKSKGIFSERLIPDVIWHSEIETRFTNLQMLPGFSDKNYFEFIIGKTNSPESIIHCINGQLLNQDFLPLILDDFINSFEENELICKPSIESGGGRGVQFIKKQDITREKLSELTVEYHGNFVMQRIIKQNKFFEQFNPTSLNTVRVLSLLYQDKVHILASFLRIGAQNSRLDNVSGGGSYIQIVDGILADECIRENLSNGDLLKSKHLENGVDFAGNLIPNWDQIVELVNSLHFKLPHFGIINWDITIDENRTPKVIEYNLIDSSTYFHQLNIGPILGNLTEDILKDLKRKI